MDKNGREQYLGTLRGEYRRGGKRQKTRLLNEAQKRTRLNRKVLIRKLSHPPAVERQRRPAPGQDPLCNDIGIPQTIDGGLNNNSTIRDRLQIQRNRRRPPSPAAHYG
jgi:hypothetical protein